MGESAEEKWKKWLRENLRGEYSKPRVLRKMKEAGVSELDAESMIEEIALEKWERIRGRIVLEIIGGVFLVLLGVGFFILEEFVASQVGVSPSMSMGVVFLGLVTIVAGIVEYRQRSGFARMAKL